MRTLLGCKMNGGIASALLPERAYAEVRRALDSFYLLRNHLYDLSSAHAAEVQLSWNVQGVNSSVLQEYVHRLESRKCQVRLPQQISTLLKA